MDSLSEEWISQPRSSTPASMRDGSFGISTTSSTSQSRIPRFKARSTSNPSVLREKASGSDGSIVHRKNSVALIERTASDLNTSSKRSPKLSARPNGQENRASPTRSVKRHISTNSISSVQQGTVQCKIPRTSPVNDENLRGTPDWKRRVLDGLGKPGEQRDLFSPMGLEHVFRPPSTRKKPQQHKERKYEPLAADEFPSSPPPFPQPSRNASPLLQNGAVTASKVPNVGAKHLGPLANQRKVPSTEKAMMSIDSHSNAQCSTNSEAVQIGMPEDRFVNSDGNATVESTPRQDAHLPATAFNMDSNNCRNGSSQTLKCKDQSRIASTNSELRNEDISVVSLPRFDLKSSGTKRLGVDTPTNQRPVDLRHLTIRSHIERSSGSSDDGIDYRDIRSSNEANSITVESADLTSHSLPDNLSTGTPEFASNGGYVNVRRGGYSAENSFRTRHLSSSSFSQSEVTAEDFPPVPQNVRTKVPQTLPPASQRRRLSSSSSTGSVVGPKTPTKTQQQACSSPDRPRSSGSPLKLFDKYDTFTNDRLVRRLSQFEESLQESCSESSSEKTKSQRTLTNSSGNTQRPRPRKSRSIPIRHDTRISSFGDGDLNRYNFIHKGLNYQTKLDYSDNKENDPSLPALHRDGRSPFKNRSIPPSTTSTASSRRRRITSPPAGTTEKLQSNDLIYGGNIQLENDIQYTGHLIPEETNTNRRAMENGGKKGKRSLNSPTKGSQPKRRRTLNADSVSAHDSDSDSAKSADSGVAPTQPLLSFIGKKRKDARYENDHQIADPRVLATRQMLRPRTPTPSQARVAGQHSAKPDAFIEKQQSITASKKGDVQPKVVGDQHTPVDSPTQILAGELLNFAIDVAQDITSGTRKVSVTTADFSNAANLVMQQIRAKGLSQHGETSAKVAGVQHLDNIQESYHEDSTQEEFSRPPSREGGSYRKSREPKQLDPRVISHLRKFEDKDDLGIALTSSLNSLQIGEYAPSLQLADVESDPPNVRIRSKQEPEGVDNLGSTGSDQHSRATQSDVQSCHSNPSSRVSSAGSNPTGSSTGSGNKAVIGPEKISHLISDQVGGMTFDRTKQLWVRRKTSKCKGNHGFDGTGSDFTDEDPLGDIPDLSVDEQEELERIRAAALGSRPPSSGTSTGCEAPPVLSALEPERIPLQAQEENVNQDANSATPSNHSRLLSCESETESQRPPCGHEFPLPNATAAGNEDLVSAAPSQNDEHQEEVEHEISIFEGRSTTPPMHAQIRHRQPRVVTVAFSSPLISHFQEPHKPTEPNDTWEDESDLDLSDSPDRPQTNRRSRSAQPTHGSTPVMSLRHSGRRVSISRHGYFQRRASTIDEHEELSLHDNLRLGRETSLNVVLATPQPIRDVPGNSLVPPQSTGGRSDVTFHLSPLPDFTLQEKDDSMMFAVGHVVKRRGLLSAQEVEGRYSLAIKELMEKITDVEPYEPYWEHIRKLDLQRKGIHTLHKLDDFCGRIEELNVSNNELDQLHGVPSSLRVLTIEKNELSNLTGWSHLRNLQYLDVSGNQIQSLQGFQGLYHLRELRADDNQIDSLNGICGLNGLIKLRLRRNQIVTVDFERADL